MILVIERRFTLKGDDGEKNGSRKESLSVLSYVQRVLVIDSLLFYQYSVMCFRYHRYFVLEFFVFSYTASENQKLRFLMKLSVQIIVLFCSCEEFDAKSNQQLIVQLRKSVKDEKRKKHRKNNTRIPLCSCVFSTCSCVLFCFFVSFSGVSLFNSKSFFHWIEGQESACFKIKCADCACNTNERVFNAVLYQIVLFLSRKMLMKGNQ